MTKNVSLLKKLIFLDLTKERKVEFRYSLMNYAYKVLLEEITCSINSYGRTNGHVQEIVSIKNKDFVGYKYADTLCDNAKQ